MKDMLGREVIVGDVVLVPFLVVGGSRDDILSLESKVVGPGGVHTCVSVFSNQCAKGAVPERSPEPEKNESPPDGAA